MRPYYVLMKLPGSARLEYLLFIPFTPPGRDNMIAWMATKCDFPDYGKTMVFTLPKEKLIYRSKPGRGHDRSEYRHLPTTDPVGPARLTCYSRKADRYSDENSFLYVVPLYLTSTGVSLPQLKQVIVVADSKVTMAATLDTALADLFGPRQAATGPPLTTSQAGDERAQLDLDQAREDFDRVKKALRQGNWGEFGNAMGALDHQLSASPN